VRVHPDPGSCMDGSLLVAFLPPPTAWCHQGPAPAARQAF
jgi:hypothetical protein